MIATITITTAAGIDHRQRDIPVATDRSRSKIVAFRRASVVRSDAWHERQSRRLAARNRIAMRSLFGGAAAGPDWNRDGGLTP